MGFRTNAYATVWEVNEGKGNYKDVRMSISKKDKNSEVYSTEWSGFARFIGDAKEKANALKERDRIKILSCDVTNTYNKEKNVTYTNYAVFDYEEASNSAGGNPSEPIFENIPVDIEEELPFI